MELNRVSNSRFNQIPMVDLKEELKLIRDPISEALSKVLDSGQYILGEKVEKLEKLIAQYIGTSYGLGVANGTDALQLSLNALNNLYVHGESHCLSWF